MSDIPAQNLEARCGNCEVFDKKRLNGDLVGYDPTHLVALGLCRVGNGLMLGSIPESSVCRHKPSQFKPIQPGLNNS